MPSHDGLNPSLDRQPNDGPLSRPSNMGQFLDIYTSEALRRTPTPLEAEAEGKNMADWAATHRLWERWASNNIGSSGEPLKAALLLNYDPSGPSRLLSIIAEQEGINLKAVDLNLFLDFVKSDNLQKEYFFVGSNQYLVTSIHEHWFCARCTNTSKPGGEGIIIMQIGGYMLIAMYEGSIVSATRAMVAVDQLSWQLSRRIH